jgi:arylsulfatase A
MDQEIGRLMAFLDTQKLANNTLVFFTSDNGPETLRRYRGAERSHGSPGPLRGMKLHLFEGGYREPAIIVWPGRISPGGVSPEPLAGVDLLPTFCDLAGVPVPKDRELDGISWRPLLEGKPWRRDKPLYWQYDRSLSKPWTVAVRDGPWKLLADNQLRQFALYNLAEDLGEHTNRAATKPERVRELATVLRKLHRHINAARMSQ